MTAVTVAYLLDGARLRSHAALASMVGHWLERKRAVDLYDHLPDDIHRLGPILCELDPDERDAARNDLDSLGRDHGASLLLLKSHHTLVTCAEHLRRCAVTIECADHSRFHLRFADTRIAELLPRVMTAGQWARFSEPWTDWRHFDRQGRLAKVTALSAQGGDTDSSGDLWSDDQLHLLTELTWPDQLIHEVQQMDAGWLADADGASRHSIAASVYEQARAIGKADDIGWQIQACLDARATRSA